jgi:hypothetical protein
VRSWSQYTHTITKAGWPISLENLAQYFKGTKFASSSLYSEKLQGLFSLPEKIWVLLRDTKFLLFGEWALLIYILCGKIMEVKRWSYNIRIGREYSRK